MNLKQTLSGLSNFIEHQVCHQVVEQTSTLDQFAQWTKPYKTCMWLESGNSGQRMLFLGEKWSIRDRNEHWVFQDKGQTIARVPINEISFIELLNLTQTAWLNQQHETCHLGLLFAYECGWLWEKRRQTKASPPPFHADIVCPEIIILQKENDSIEIFHDSNCSFNLDEKLDTTHNNAYAKECKISLREDQDSYIKKVCQVKDEIRAGNSFQVNLSQEIQCHGPLDSLSWAKALFSKEPAPFMAYVKNPHLSVVSLSPERLIKQTSTGQLITRPIAGTLPKKGPFQGNPEQFKQDFKELAEHNMLIDLERNDLGRVCQAGSVHVHEYLCVEELHHLYHLVSEVRGQAQTGINLGEIIRALFPGGTITGCPKLETMHIIDLLESSPRGPYTGSLGYIKPSGELDLNILIRTAWIQNNCCTMRFGGGIVWDSKPEKEYLETLSKAKGLIRSLLIGGAELDPHYRSLRQFFL